MANSADPDQLASLESNWFGSTLFANAGYVQVQQIIYVYIYIMILQGDKTDRRCYK